MPDAHARISVIVMTREAASDIADCLGSVPGAGEIIVADTGSRDDTVTRAAEAGARVIALPWEGFGPTRRAAFAQAEKEWIFWLDADERVTPRLWAAVAEAVAAGDGPAGYLVDRRANFLGRWMRGGGWGRDSVLRLFRRSAYRVIEKRVHESVEVTGRVARLEGELLHLTDPTLAHYLDKFNRYTTLAAQDLCLSGRRARLADLLFRPPWTFLKMYLFRAGFVDGVPGLVLATLSGAYVFVKYAKLRQLHHQQSR